MRGGEEAHGPLGEEADRHEGHASGERHPPAHEEASAQATVRVEVPSCGRLEKALATPTIHLSGAARLRSPGPLKDVPNTTPQPAYAAAYATLTVSHQPFPGRAGSHQQGAYRARISHLVSAFEHRPISTSTIADKQKPPRQANAYTGIIVVDKKEPRDKETDGWVRSKRG